MQAAALVYKVTCAQTGQSDLAQLTDDLSGQIQKDELEQILGNKQLFAVVCGPDGKKTVIAKTQLRHCKAQDCSGCSNLHLCKFYLLCEDCPHNRGRRVCRFSHDLYSDHNSQVLRQHYVQELQRGELCTLLLQNDYTLLPPVCFTFNRGKGEFGYCSDKDSCRRLHICEKYLRGNCDTGDCDRSHDFFEPHPMGTLQARGVSSGMVGSLLSVYRNILAMKDSNNPGIHCRGGPKEICLFHIKTYCKQGNRCGKVHFDLPYRWEFKDRQGWSGLTDNEAIEQDYCDPAKTYSGGNVPVHFDTMTRNSVEVRRISTASSVTQPNFMLTTRWAWYWEDEFENWTQYTSSEGAHHSASITTEELEKRYQEGNNAVIEFTAGKHTYELSMQDMIQTNKRFGTKRLMRRRPLFVSATEVQNIKSSSVQTHKGIPRHWDKLDIPETGFKRVQVASSSEEYIAIVHLFNQSMSGFRVSSIERVQNRSLWQVFQWQADQMRKRNSGNTNEKILFHGTDSKHIDAICQQNFDWRICGTHGTAYGKGSYFARDARYSDKYTSPSGTRFMFASRVLLGKYTKGSSSYVRPPPKEENMSVFYDSCVNSMSDPSIFVVFEKHQVYPEYLIQYIEDPQPSAAHVSRNIPPQGALGQSRCLSVPSPKTNLATVPVDTTFTAGSTIAISADGRALRASARASEVVFGQPDPTRHSPRSVTTTSAMPATNADSSFNSSSPAKRGPVNMNDTTLTARPCALPGAIMTPTSSTDGFVMSMPENTLASRPPFSVVPTLTPVKPSLTPKPASVSHSQRKQKKTKEISDATYSHLAVSEVIHTPVSRPAPHGVTSMGSPSVSQPEAAVRVVSDRNSIMNLMARGKEGLADSTSLPMHCSCVLPGGAAVSETHTPPSLSKFASPSDDLKGVRMSAVSPATQNVASGGSVFISDLEGALHRARERRRDPGPASRTLSSPSSNIPPSATSQNRLSSSSPTNMSQQTRLRSWLNDSHSPSPTPRRVPSSSFVSDTAAPSSFSDLIDYFQKLNQKQHSGFFPPVVFFSVTFLICKIC